jgi:segregation and condensation protein A
MWLPTEDEYSYSNLLLTLPDPPLGEPLRRQAKRKVTLIELLDAFHEARVESEAFQLMEKSREEAREELFLASRKRMVGTAHDDNIESDITAVWDKIQHATADPLCLFDLCEVTNRDDLMKTFVSILFLASENKIKVYQRKFPYGKIFIKTVRCT